MNQLAHFLINFIVFSYILEDAKKYIFPIFILSWLLDIDHISGYLYILKNKPLVTIKENVEKFRTVIQEPIGILFFEVIIGILFLLGFNKMILFIASISILLHWIIDFLTVHTRPLYPFNDKIVSILFHTKKQRIISEIIITLIAIIIFVARL